MVTRERPRVGNAVIVAFLTVVLSAPLVGPAWNHVLADEPVLTAEDVPSGAVFGEVSRDVVVPLPNTLPAALAAGTRAESAHLATVPLPDAPVDASSDDRIAGDLFSDALQGDARGATSGGGTIAVCSLDALLSGDPWAAPPEPRGYGEPY